MFTAPLNLLLLDHLHHMGSQSLAGVSRLWKSFPRDIHMPPTLPEIK